MAVVTITWRAFSEIPAAFMGRNPLATATIDADAGGDDLALCDQLFEETNLYSGPLWEKIEAVMPADRTHTALSVMDGIGDFVSIDGRIYEVAAVGWRRVN